MASMLRFGVGVAVLGYGACAVPSSKVAFVQHCAGEGDEAMVYAPSSSRVSSLSPQLLSSAVARVMSLDSRPELGTDLPSGDIFNRPDGNVMVLLDGVRAQGSKSAPFITESLRQSTAVYYLKSDDNWGSHLENILGQPFDVAHEVQERGGVVCAAVDPALSSSEACYSATWALPPHTLRERAWENGASMGPGVKQDLSTGLRALRLKGGAGVKGGDEDVVLDLEVEADLELAEELSFLSQLAATLSGRFPPREESNPPLVIVYLSSLKAIRTMYGETSVKGSRAFAAMDAALAEFFEAIAGGAGRCITSQLVVGPALKDGPEFGRRLHTDSTSESTSETTNSSAVEYSMAEIQQYQLNLWTGVFLVLLGFLAIYATVTMDVQPDSLLYAKFITDTTTGSGLKTD